MSGIFDHNMWFLGGGDLPEEEDYCDPYLTYEGYIKLQQESGFPVLSDYEKHDLKLPRWYDRTMREIQNMGENYVAKHWEN